MPDTDILNQEQVAEIEARPYIQVGWGRRVELTVEERDALCRTLGAAWGNEIRLAKEVVDLREQLARLSEASGEWAGLLDRIRLWSKCADGYPLDEHVNNIATQLAQLTETLTTIEACKNPKCGHCMALLRTTRRG